MTTNRVLRHPSSVFLLFLLTGIFAGSAAFAAPALKLVSPPQKVEVGAIFTFQVQLEWPTGEGPYEVRSDNPLFEKLGLIHQSQSQETTAAGVRTDITLELQALHEGDGRILPFEVRFKKPDDASWQIMPVAGQRVLIYKPFPWRALFTAFAILAGSGLAGGATFFVLRLRTEAIRKKNTPPPDPRQRAYAHAEESIATFKGETQKETIAHWAAQLKQTVLTYYGIPEKSVTEAELLAILRGRGLPSGEFAEIHALFRDIEQLKFTRQALTVREIESLQKQLLKYIRGKIIIEKPSKNG